MSVDLLVLEMVDYDVIWGMDWLSVTPRAKRAGSDLDAQGTDKERLLAKDLAEGHRDELTPHQKEKDSETM